MKLKKVYEVFDICTVQHGHCLYVLDRETERQRDTETKRQKLNIINTSSFSSIKLDRKADPRHDDEECRRQEGGKDERCPRSLEFNVKLARREGVLWILFGIGHKVDLNQREFCMEYPSNLIGLFNSDVIKLRLKITHEYIFTKRFL
jgi:hypothetical protein